MGVLPLDSLPLGFRFHPTDEELINHYLRGKISGRETKTEVIPEVDVCKCEPWDLPSKSIIRTDDPEWFFFCPRDRKYPNGHRSNRATKAGFWKATGKDRKIKSRSPGLNLIGTKKTLVFYIGRAPNGERTNWIIHEYRSVENGLEDSNGCQDAFVLCRLFKKPEEKNGNPSCDIVEPSGFSPTTSKSSPDDALHPVAAESNQSVDIDKWLEELLDDGTSDPPVQDKTDCSSYMVDQEQDGSGCNEQMFQSLDSKDSVQMPLVLENTGSLAGDWNRAGSLGPFHGVGFEQDVSSTASLWEQWFMHNQYPEEGTPNSTEGPDDTGIQIRSRGQRHETDPHLVSFQGDARRRVRLQMGFMSVNDSTSSKDSEDHENEEPAIEVGMLQAGGRILEPVDDAKQGATHKKAVAQSANTKYICTISRRRPRAKAATIHQEDSGEFNLTNESLSNASSLDASSKSEIEEPGSKSKPNKDNCARFPSLQPTKTRFKIVIRICVALFIITIILVTGVWRGHMS